MTAPAHRTPPKVPRPTPAPVVPSPRVAALEAALAAAPDDDARRGVLDAFWAEADRTPLVDPAPLVTGEHVVTFLWRDADAEEVLLFVNRLTDERALADSVMRRVPGTDVWHLAYRMGPAWRASYAVLRRGPGERAPWRDAADQVSVRAALDRGLADPRNPLTCRNRAGVVQSVAELPDAPTQRWLHPRPEVPRGRVDRHDGPDGRTVWTYAPAAPAERPTPLLVMLDGDVWTGPQDLATTLDNLVADGEIPPVHAVLLDAGGRERRWQDLDEDGGLDAYLVGALLPWARDRLPVSHDAADVVVAGQSLGALTALWTAVRHPGAVGAVLSQSASLWQEGLLADVERREPGALQGVRVRLEVGAQEWVLRPPHGPVAAALRAAGADVELVEFDGGHDYACWRGGVADGLRALLGPSA